MLPKKEQQTAGQAAQAWKDRLDKWRKEHPDQAIPPKPLPKESPCRPDCPICGGLGWIRKDLPQTDDNFGKLIPCPNLSTWSLVGNLSGLEPTEINMTWDNLLLSDEKVIKAKAEAQALLHRGYGWLTLWGEYGTAKTHILKICTAAILQERRQAIYVRMSDLLDDLRAAYDEQNPNEAAIRKLDWYAEAYCLAIDEFDKVSKTAWVGERSFSLMDKRYELGIHRKGITLLAMNANPAKLEGYISDRIADGRFRVVSLANKSLRPGLTWEDHQRIYQGTYEGDNWNTSRREETGGSDE